MPVFFDSTWLDLLISVSPFGFLYLLKRIGLYRLPVIASGAIIIGVMCMVTRHVEHEGGFAAVDGQAVGIGMMYIIGGTIYIFADHRAKRKEAESQHSRED